MSKPYLKYVGSQTRLRSRRWGNLTIEAAHLSPAIDGDLVVYVGEPLKQANPLVRIHSECVFAEAFDSSLCDCADQFAMAMRRLVDEGHGILVYLRLDGRGAGLAAKVKATALEIKGADTFDSRVAIDVEPESRDFTSVAKFLRKKKIQSIRLLTNNPQKSKDLELAGLHVDVEPLLILNPSDLVRRLYETKRDKFGHNIPLQATKDPQMDFEF